MHRFDAAGTGSTAVVATGGQIDRCDDRATGQPRVDRRQRPARSWAVHNARYVALVAST